MICICVFTYLNDKKKQGEKRKIRIMLLAGGDLIASFGHPGVWTSEDVSSLVHYYIKVCTHHTHSSCIIL
jgi:hypothetical protein